MNRLRIPDRGARPDQVVIRGDFPHSRKLQYCKNIVKYYHILQYFTIFYNLFWEYAGNIFVTKINRDRFRCAAAPGGIADPAGALVGTENRRVLVTEIPIVPDPANYNILQYCKISQKCITIFYNIFGPEKSLRMTT